MMSSAVQQQLAKWPCAVSVAYLAESNSVLDEKVSVSPNKYHSNTSVSVLVILYRENDWSDVELIWTQESRSRAMATSLVDNNLVRFLEDDNDRIAAVPDMKLRSYSTRYCGVLQKSMREVEVKFRVAQMQLPFRAPASLSEGFSHRVPAS